MSDLGRRHLPFPRMGMPGVTSLLPGRLQRLQVSLSSSLEVPAGKLLERPTCRPCVGGTLRHQATHLSAGSHRSMRVIHGSM